MTSDVVTVDGRTVVVRVMVKYGSLESRPWRDLWVIRFAEDGRCCSFEEWPFAPDSPMGTSQVLRHGLLASATDGRCGTRAESLI
jgi:hypothetical protein